MDTGNLTREQERERLEEFLTDYYELDAGQNKVYKYVKLITELAHRERVTLQIDLDDMHNFDPTMCKLIVSNAKRYLSHLYEIVQELLPKYRTKDVQPLDSFDIYTQHRLLMESRLAEQNPGVQQKMFPSELMRRFEIYFKKMSLSKSLPIRQVKGEHVGQLINVRGIATRCTEVKPMICVAAYSCDACGAETYHPVRSLSFMPLVMCPSEECRVNKKSGRLQLQTKGSKFIKFQEITIQEPSDVVPVGHIPRTMNVFCRGENTRIVFPGNHISVTGVFLPLLREGLGPMFHGIITDHFLEAQHIEILHNTENEAKEDYEKDFTESEKQEIAAGNLYNRLAHSLAPEIYGHEDVKKALLLLLVGGIERRPDGMKIRGNIHMCLMGDPGVAKSQLLAHINRIAARSQYTTGRGSTGVGLTAAVTRDPLTDEVTLESGALVLADQGICCIDEFDKMSEYDRTAIHEAMEQQTISIAKAGISTSLNARVSVLAAANPAYGRYNPRKTVEQNIQLPAALLSRFDLIWLMRDLPDRVNDLRLAQHITHVHRCNIQPATEVSTVDPKFFKKYIAKCRTLNPIVPEDLSDYIVQNYVELRKRARNDKDMTFTSPRNLLAVLRLGTALARLRMADTVVKGDIQEAIRLIEKSKQSIASFEDAPKRPANAMDHIYEIVRDVRGDDVGPVKMSDIMARCVAFGFNPHQVKHSIEEYEKLNIWIVNQARTELTFL